MPTTPRSIHSLRAVIDRLPVPTRVAMLEGVDSSTIIVGAYTSRDGGECPMLAAHRRGGRAEGGIDYVTGARGPRPATRRELGILRAQLQSSLLAEHDVDLAGAIREHRATTRGNEPDLATAISEHRELVRRRVEHEQPEREFGLIRALDRRSRDRRRRAAAYEQALDRL